jgi:hypothetical protein
MSFVAARHGILPGCSERGAKRRGYSAATTTAAARDATQINCAATGEHKLNAGGHDLKLTQCQRHQANSGASADRRSSALGTPAVRYRCRPSASKMNVVGRDITDRRFAAPGLSSMSISTWATSPRSSQTWSTTRRTWEQGEHQVALKCTTVGPSPDSPRSLVSMLSAIPGSVARRAPARRVSSQPMRAATANAATRATIEAINGRTPYRANPARTSLQLLKSLALLLRIAALCIVAGASCLVEPVERDG